MATQKEVALNGRETVDCKSPLLKKPASLVLSKDEHVRKKRKMSFEVEAKPELILENSGKARHLSSSEESWNITSVSRSPSPTKAANSLKTTLKKIKKEGMRFFFMLFIDLVEIKSFRRRWDLAKRTKFVCSANRL